LAEKYGSFDILEYERLFLGLFSQKNPIDVGFFGEKIGLFCKTMGLV